MHSKWHWRLPRRIRPLPLKVLRKRAYDKTYVKRAQRSLQSQGVEYLSPTSQKAKSLKDRAVPEQDRYRKLCQSEFCRNTYLIDAKNRTRSKFCPPCQKIRERKLATDRARKRRQEYKPERM